MKYILFTSSLWLLWSCSLTQKSVQTLKYPISQDSNTPLENSVALIDDELMSNPSATLIIDSTRLEENYLWIQYHDFSTDGSLVMVGNEAIAKSFPPIRTCKIIIKPSSQNSAPSGWLKIDITALSNKKVKDSPIYLQLEGWPEKILYLYPY